MKTTKRFTTVDAMPGMRPLRHDEFLDRMKHRFTASRDAGEVSEVIGTILGAMDPAARETVIRTTDMMLTAGPASRTPSLGRVYGGGGDYSKGKPADIDTIWTAIELGLSSLTVAEAAEIRKRMRKYCGSESMSPNRIGISTSTGDQVSPTTDHIKDANARSLRQMRDDNVSRVEEINRANRAQWDWDGKPAA